MPIPSNNLAIFRRKPTQSFSFGVTKWNEDFSHHSFTSRDYLVPVDWKIAQVLRWQILRWDQFVTPFDLVWNFKERQRWCKGKIHAWPRRDQNSISFNLRNPGAVQQQRYHICHAPNISAGYISTESLLVMLQPNVKTSLSHLIYGRVRQKPIFFSNSASFTGWGSIIGKIVHAFIMWAIYSFSTN